MNRLSRIAKAATPSSGVQFRQQTYGKSGLQQFLKDVLAMANSPVEGPRYIITGIGFDGQNQKTVVGVDADDFAGRPDYCAIANDHIEPPIRMRYHSIRVDSHRVGVFEIGECQDRPYMMRIDHSETLRRGDAYARHQDSAVKLGRRQLQSLFEKKFRDSVSAAHIEIGFPGEIIHKDLRLATQDFSKLPSAVASRKLNELIEAKERVQVSATNTFMARLMHARLFGTDRPYEERSTEDIIEEMKQMEDQYVDHDRHFLFNVHNSNLQMVIFNHGDEVIQDASLTFVLPNHEALRVATRVPKSFRDEEFVERSPIEQEGYPSVTLGKKAIKVAAKLDDIPPGSPVEVFERPLRLCAATELAGKKLGIQYEFQARNLRAPIKGKVRLVF